MHFSDAITEYSFDCKVRKLSAKTISNYQKQLRYLQRYSEEEFQIKEVEDVRSFHIKQFLSMMDDKERKARYINDLLKVFKTFFNYLKKEGHIKERPTANVKNMKQPKVKIITFSEAEIRRLLNHFSGRTFLSIRNRAILAMFFDTGMRLTEVITLCPNQLREDHIIVHGKGNKERLVPVSPYLAKTLMQYQIARESYFEGKLAYNYQGSVCGRSCSSSVGGGLGTGNAEGRARNRDSMLFMQTALVIFCLQCYNSNNLFHKGEEKNEDDETRSGHFFHSFNHLVFLQYRTGC